MLEGLSITLSVFFLTLIISIPLGVVIAFMRMSSKNVISQIARLYILVLRGTPLLLQLIFIFFGLPLIGIVFDRFTAAVVAFGLNYAAYYAEIFRGGIQSIDRGQYEGAIVLGMSKTHMYRRIICPQVIKRILPSMSNEVITLIKDTAIVYTIGLNDILRIAQIAQNQKVSLVPLIEAGVVYLILIGIITYLFKKIENRYSYYI